MRKLLALLLCVVCLTGCHQSEDGKLTLKKVTELSKKGDALTWDDFAPYDGEEIGSGLYIVRYDIDDSYELLVGSSGIAAPPDYILLVLKADESVAVDIRTENAADFISRCG